MLSLTSDLSVELPMDGSDMQNGCPSGARLELPEVLYERQHGLSAFGTEGDAKAVAVVESRQRSLFV